MGHPTQGSVRPGGSAGSVPTVASKAGLSMDPVQRFDGLRILRFNLSNVEIAMTDATTSGSYGSQKLCDLPEGLVMIPGAITDLDFVVATGIDADAVLKHAIGSAAEATNDTLDSVQANVVPSTSVTLASSAGSKSGVSTAAAWVDGHTTAGALYLNLGVPDADSTANSTATVSGEITIVCMVIGDGAN